MYANDRNYNNRQYGDRRGPAPYRYNPPQQQQGSWGRPDDGYRPPDYDRGFPQQQGGGYGWGQGRRFRFDIGQKVVHTATGIELTVISFGREQLECRKPDLGVVWCYEHELEAVGGPEPMPNMPIQQQG